MDKHTSTSVASLDTAPERRWSNDGTAEVLGTFALFIASEIAALSVGTGMPVLGGIALIFAVFSIIRRQGGVRWLYAGLVVVIPLFVWAFSAGASAI